MSDDIQLQWRVTTMDCYPNFSGEKDYVFNVHWDCLSYYSGISGGPFYGRTFSVTAVPINTGSFTPYDKLEETQVLDWIWEVIGTGDKQKFEENSFQQIYSQIKPPVVQPTLPWQPDVFPIIAPTIVTQPVSGYSLMSGMNGNIFVQANGQPLNYTWHKDGIDITGYNFGNYIFNNIQPEQSGYYDVTIYNSMGSVLSSGCNVEVLLPYPPSIYEQPVNTSGYLNNPASFSVSISGYPIPTFQWRKDGENISGGTYQNYSFTITNESTGVYDVVVNNYLGEVISDSATVTLLPPLSPV